MEASTRLPERKLLIRPREDIVVACVAQGGTTYRNLDYIYRYAVKSHDGFDFASHVMAVESELTESGQRVRRP